MGSVESCVRASPSLEVSDPLGVMRQSRHPTPKGSDHKRRDGVPSQNHQSITLVLKGRDSLATGILPSWQSRHPTPKGSDHQATGRSPVAEPPYHHPRPEGTRFPGNRYPAPFRIAGETKSFQSARVDSPSKLSILFPFFKPDLFRGELP
jgi:hypothetical protein